MQVFAVERVGDAQHHRGVGLRPGRDPLGIQILRGLGADRVDADRLGALLFQPVDPEEGAVVGHLPADLRVAQRVGAPEHHEFGVLDDVRPGRALLVNLDRAGHIGQDHLGRPGGIVAHRAGESAVQLQEPPQQGLAVVHPSRALPPVGAAEDRLGAVAVAHPHQFAREKLGHVVPAHPDEIIGAAAGGVRARPLFQPGPPHHRILDPRGRIDRIQHPLQLRRGPGIPLPRPDRGGAPVLDGRAEHAPVAAGQDLGPGRLREGCAARKGGIRHAEGRHGRALAQEAPAREAAFAIVARSAARIAHLRVSPLSSNVGCCPAEAAARRLTPPRPVARHPWNGSADRPAADDTARRSAR